MAEFADDPPPPVARPATAPQVGKPASDEVSLAGKDGKELVKLIRASKARGVKLMADLVGAAVGRYKGLGPLLRPPEVRHLADAIAAVNATADLLGRSRVRELHGRAVTFSHSPRTEDVPFSRFADAPPGILATPGAAVEYFTGLHPELGIDPKRYGEHARRAAFTLAESANKILTAKVQAIVAEALKSNASTPDATDRIRKAFDAAGVSPKNPQYSEMVFRTNAMDAYQQGVYEEGRHPDVADLFPAWQYLGIRDGRQGADHEPHFDRYYPSGAPFADVRGPRPFNCRCSLRWVDQFEWEDLTAKGHSLESDW